MQRFRAVDEDSDGSVTPGEIYDIPSNQVEKLLAPPLSGEEEEEEGEEEEGDSNGNSEEKGKDKSSSNEHIEL